MVGGAVGGVEVAGAGAGNVLVVGMVVVVLDRATVVDAGSLSASEVVVEVRSMAVSPPLAPQPTRHRTVTSARSGRVM